MTGPDDEQAGDGAERRRAPSGPGPDSRAGAAAGAAGSPAGSPAGSRAGSRRRRGSEAGADWTARILVFVGAALGVALLVVIFFFGMRFAGGTVPAEGSASPTPSDASAAASPHPSPSPTPTAPPLVAAPAASGPVAPGVHAWNELQGGECLSGFTSAWDAQFTVVDCGTDHTAQLVTRQAFTDDPAAPYPGEAALVARLNLLCTAPTVLNYDASGQFDDVQWQASYPVSDQQWSAGDRFYACFFSRSSGQPLTGSLAVTP